MDSATRAKIRYEVSQIDELVDKAQALIALCRSREPDFIEITAVGGILHAFYNGLENIFVLVGKTVGFNFSDSPQWHRNLVDAMFALPHFLPAAMHPKLSEYRGFRHFFRHTYGYTIKWEKCAHLFLGIPEFWQSARQATIQYCESAS